MDELRLLRSLRPQRQEPPQRVLPLIWIEIEAKHMAKHSASRSRVDRHGRNRRRGLPSRTHTALAKAQYRSIMSAAAIASVLTGSVVWFAGQRDQTEVVVAGPSEPAVAELLLHDAEATANPLVLPDSRDWRLTFASGRSRTHNAVTYREIAEPAGAVVVVEVAQTDLEPSFGNATTSRTEELFASFTGRQSAFLEREIDESESMWLTGAGVGLSTLSGLAAVIEVDEVGATKMPLEYAGLSLGAEHVEGIVNRLVEYQFEDGHGRTLSVAAYGGGALIANARNPSSAGLMERTLDNGQWLILEGLEQNRAQTVSGLWYWEVDGRGFTNVDSFIEVVESLAAVTSAVWEENLPADIVSPSARGAAVAAMLADVPIPEHFDLASFRSDLTEDRMQLGMSIGSAVACGWLGEWHDARQAGDHRAAAAAAVALSGSQHWPILVEVAREWDLPNVIWRAAEIVNGERPIAASGETSLSQLMGLLGCS